MTGRTAGSVRDFDLPFLRQPYPQDWLLADVGFEGRVDVDAVNMFFPPNGLPRTCIPMGQSRCRIVMANAGDRHGQTPNLDEIQDLINQRAPWPIVVAIRSGWRPSAANSDR